MATADLIAIQCGAGLLSFDHTHAGHVRPIPPPAIPRRTTIQAS